MGEFKIDLLNADAEEDNEEVEEKRAPSLKQNKDSKISPKKKKTKSIIIIIIKFQKI